MRNPPTYQHHRPSDQARVWYHSRYVYLGKYGSEESRQRYKAIVDRWMIEKPRPRIEAHSKLTIKELTAVYLDYCKRRYRKRGRTTSEYDVIKSALTPLIDSMGDVGADEFKPEDLLDLREAYIDRGWVRNSCNQQMGRVRSMWKWGVSRSYVRLATYQALMTVEGLRAHQLSESGKTVKEAARVKGVSNKTIEATIAELPQHVGDMIRVQRLTAMRPGELVQMRGCDIDRRGPIWLYTPAEYKTEHITDSPRRIIAIGPKAQKILEKYLAVVGDGHIFTAPRTGRPYARTGYRSIVRYASDRANLRAVEAAEAAGEESPPAWGRGLKYRSGRCLTTSSKVAPRVGAWIEIRICNCGLPGRVVAPRVGAWIEMSPSNHSNASLLVAPRVGAWIEILRGIAWQIITACRPPRGGVD